MYMLPKFSLSVASPMRRCTWPSGLSGRQGVLLTPSSVPVRRPAFRHTCLLSLGYCTLGVHYQGVLPQVNDVEIVIFQESKSTKARSFIALGWQGALQQAHWRSLQSSYCTPSWQPLQRPASKSYPCLLSNIPSSNRHS